MYAGHFKKHELNFLSEIGQMVTGFAHQCSKQIDRLDEGRLWCGRQTVWLTPEGACYVWDIEYSAALFRPPSLNISTANRTHFLDTTWVAISPNRHSNVIQRWCPFTRYKKHRQIPADVPCSRVMKYYPIPHFLSSGRQNLLSDIIYSWIFDRSSTQTTKRSCFWTSSNWSWNKTCDINMTRK